MGEKNVNPTCSLIFSQVENSPKTLHSITLHMHVIYAYFVLSLQSEVFALTFYPHILFPPVAAGYAAISRRNFAQGSKSGDTHVNKTHPDRKEDINMVSFFF